MADINLESQSPVAIGANDAAIVRRGTGGVNTGPFTAELVQLGSLATQSGTFSGTSSGTNTGDQTITLTGAVTGSGTGSFAASLGSFTKAQLDAAVSDGNVLYVGDVTTNATHTGDATGATALTLATVNSNVGSFGSATQVATFTVNAKGLTTAAGNTSIAIPASQVTDFSEAVDDRVSALVVAGTNMTITYNDAANTLTFDASGGGAGTNLTYTAATRVIASDTGTDATLPLVSSGDAGLAPASGGGTTNFLRADGTWAAPGGGGGSGDVVGPASATDNALARFDSTTGKLIQNSAVTLDDNGGMTFPAIATPATPAAGNVTLFGRAVAGRILPSIIGPSGLDTALNPHLGRNKVAMWQGTGNNGTDTNFGFVASSTGTSSTETVSTTNLHTYMRRRSWLVGTASTTAVAGFRGSATMWTLGGTAAGLGGFHLIIRWGPATGVSTSTHRCFMGMRNVSSAPTDVNPSTLTNLFGMGYDSADANVQFMHNDGSGTATKIDLGASFARPTADRTAVYEVALFSPPGTTQSLSYQITDLVSAATATGTVTTDIPTTSTLLNPWGYISVGGTSSVIGLMVSSLYCESDS